MSSHVIVIGRIFHQDSLKVLCIDHDQMISALAPNRPDQAFNISGLPRRPERRRPVPDPVPTVNPIHWHIQSNRVMLVLDDEYFRADLTCLDRAVALESGTSG